ncbi:MAG: hypothetical protein WDM78_23460 [Puia sp.]
MLIVVVAELDRSAIEQKVKELTANIPEGNNIKLNRYSYSPARNSFTAQKKSVATNYIQGVSGGPATRLFRFQRIRLLQWIYFLTNNIWKSERIMDYPMHHRLSS